jgi:hypothetical protein
MDKTIKIINDNKERFSHFVYYLNLTDKIQENIELLPDISIESCKSLIEGISKTILKTLNVAYIEKGRNADSPDNLVKKVIDELSKYSNIDTVFSQGICSFVKRISEVRNERGDISHGKAAPKDVNSDVRLAMMVAHLTDGMVEYILKIFFGYDWSFVQVVKYEDNVNFNEFLDSQYELEGVIYSQALFEQDFTAYNEKLKNYLADRGK